MGGAASSIYDPVPLPEMLIVKPIEGFDFSSTSNWYVNLTSLLNSPTAIASKPAKDGLCNHYYLEQWGDDLVCCDCAGRKCPDFKIKDEIQIENEKILAKKLGDEESCAPEYSVFRGVTIQFLIEFCNCFNLWDLTTRDVRRNFVIPLTSHSRCRFVELLDKDVVGRADTFISHSWGAKFGDLVAAICDNCSDRRRKVWLDIFAVRQWPTTKPDLDFEVVIRQCSSFLVFCPTIPEVEKMQMERQEVPVEVRPQIPFFRVWCLYEVYYAAITVGTAIVMKAGHYSLLEGSSYCFINNREMLKNLSDSIDVHQAGATNPADKAFIFGKIEAFEDGVTGFNHKLWGVLSAAFILCGNPELQSAACGDLFWKEEIFKEPAKYIVKIAIGGFLTLLTELLNRFPDLVTQTDANGTTLLMEAAKRGHTDCVSLLISKGADIHARNVKYKETALSMAAAKGQKACVEMLIGHGASVHSRCMDGTPLLLAIGGGHAECVDILLRNGADVTAKDNFGSSALIWAATVGRPDIMESLLEGGADVNERSDGGPTALMRAAEFGQ